jgi:Fe-S-cluster containining protein
MFAQLEHLFRFVDETVAAIYDQHPQAVRCRPGCADCCHAVFDVSFIEAAAIAAHLKQQPELRQRCLKVAEEAAEAYEELLRSAGDPGLARIRCPLLGDDDLCLAHGVRPINCRTYGTPTVIDGRTHVCGLSNFRNRDVYPTVDLEPLQASLNRYSVGLVGEEFGNRRFPIAWVVLRTDFFLPR